MSTETNYEPLLPSDATKLLAERRWNQESQPSKEETPSPPLLNEEQLYGKAGVEQAAGYTEMASAFPVKAPIEGEVSEKEASAELLKDREPPPGERPVDAEIQYLNIDTGKPKAPNETVSAEQAAADLSRYRQGIAETQRALEDVELHRVIDSLRAGDAAQQSPPVEAQPPQQQTAEQTPASEQTTPANNEQEAVRRALEQHPELLDAFRTLEYQSSERANAAEKHFAEAAQQVAQHYAAAVQQNAVAATAALVSQFPELHNLSAEQVPVAIKTVAQSNPERAQAMVRHIEGTQNLIAEAQRVQAAQMLQGYQQAAQQQFSAWAKQCDDAYENWASKEVSAAERTLIEAEARQMVADEYGASQE